MKSLYNIYEVSILGDIDDQIEAADNAIKYSVEEWIRENYACTGLKISDKPNKDGLYEVTARNVEVTNKNITSLTNGMFKWKKTKLFDCSICYSLTSLEGAPKEVGENFDCSSCYSLTSLEGAPKKVGGRFDCYNCFNLESLEGAPKEVRGDFYCYNCTSLESLKGASEKVGGDFSCSYCASLTSLEGAPKEVEGSFNCYKCKTQFTIEDVKNVSNVKGRINVKI